MLAHRHWPPMRASWVGVAGSWHPLLCARAAPACRSTQAGGGLKPFAFDVTRPSPRTTQTWSCSSTSQPLLSATCSSSSTRLLGHSQIVLNSPPVAKVREPPLRPRRGLRVASRLACPSDQRAGGRRAVTPGRPPAATRHVDCAHAAILTRQPIPMGNAEEGFDRRHLAPDTAAWRGANAIVWAAEHDGKEMALKVLHALRRPGATTASRRRYGSTVTSSGRQPVSFPCSTPLCRLVTPSTTSRGSRCQSPSRCSSTSSPLSTYEWSSSTSQGSRRPLLTFRSNTASAIAT